MLSNAEHVINAKATTRYRSLLDAMNNRATIPGLAGGGQVSLTPAAYSSSTSVSVGSPNVGVSVYFDGEVIDARARVVVGHEQAKIARAKGRAVR